MPPLWKRLVCTVGFKSLGFGAQCSGADGAQRAAAGPKTGALKRTARKTPRMAPSTSGISNDHTYNVHRRPLATVMEREAYADAV